MCISRFYRNVICAQTRLQGSVASASSVGSIITLPRTSCLKTAFKRKSDVCLKTGTENALKGIMEEFKICTVFIFQRRRSDFSKACTQCKMKKSGITIIPDYLCLVYLLFMVLITMYAIYASKTALHTTVAAVQEFLAGVSSM